MTLLAAPPHVVGTINPNGLAGLVCLPATDRHVDIVEARFDLALPDVVNGKASAPPIPPPLRRDQASLLAPIFAPFLASCARLEQTGMPVLATIRLIPDGGRWVEDVTRLPWFDQALAVVSWVDIEIESALAGEIVRLARARGKRVIISHHDFAGTPDLAVLTALTDRARAAGADIVKVATAVDSLEAHDRLIDLLRAQRASPGAPLAVIGMGPIGTSLRTYLPSVGSSLTYGYLDSVAAPGQIDARDLVRRLIVDCPAYADRRRGQGRL